jgi:hypothetical protein
MKSYQGYPEPVAARPRIPVRNTLPVVYVTPGAVHRFLAAHPGSPAIFLLEYLVPGGRFPASAHRQSVSTLRRFGYCPTRAIPLPYTGQLTILTRARCPGPRASAGG